MRIAIHDKDRCKPKDCNYLCMRMCPVNKTGGECITVSEETRKPVISEVMCTGCGICVKKCPYDAIKIINLPEEIGEPVHQYGVNGFRLYNLPTPREGVVGIVGCNGIGKSTALRIMSGEIRPNLGKDAGWEDVLERYKGREIQGYVERLSRGEVKAVVKPQYVESIPKVIEGDVKSILDRADERGLMKSIVDSIDLKNSMEKDVKSLSGGELQRLAIAVCLLKEADMYLIDEPSSYLDVRERLNVARVIRNMGDKYVFVVEHDLAVLDYLSDHVHVIFGNTGAYGIISNIMGVRVGINEYLSGFLRSENMRFREAIKFDVKPPSEKSRLKTLAEYPEMVKTYREFTLRVKAGKISTPEVLGILGPNATGKTTYVKMLAGVEEPDEGGVDLGLTVSYKPQYIKTSEDPVLNLRLKPEIVGRFRINHLFDRKLSELSGGELQKVAVVDCLSQDADIYMLDEPSAYLDVEERISLAKYLRSFALDNKKSIMVVDHDILIIDYLSDELLVFAGEAGKTGTADKPLEMQDGMNNFLKAMDVTFRRDSETGRPRANKPDSVKDREQRSTNRYYYTG
ncbi:MAG: ribosome biogenesis/translation initiation ATPase RLI [Candidatus Altiarchaeota archaeon]